MARFLRYRWCVLAALAPAVGPNVASAQVVAGWSHETAAGVEFAFFTLRTEELTVRCKGQNVEVYYVDMSALDPGLKGRPSAVFAVVVDGAAETLWTGSRLIAESNVVSIGVGGAMAADLTRRIAGAARNIQVSILVGPPQLDSVQYNVAHFPVHGAADAIKAAYAGCGIK
jgi:hypothetical protein